MTASADTVGLVTDGRTHPKTAAASGPEHVRIAIVGSGFSGLGVAIKLLERGIEDFVVLDRADDVGGTWEANTYPGCQCDVPSHLYSFSFDLNPGWTRTYSRQPEIWAYLRRCADRYGLADHLRLGHELTARDVERGLAAAGTSRPRAPSFTAHLLIDATGPLSHPAVPRIHGLDGFEGKLFHSAALGPRPRPRRRARRGHRHRRVRDPVRPADPAAGRQAARLPAHGAVDHAAHRPPHDAPGAPALPPLPALQRAVRTACTGRARRSCSASPRTRSSPARRSAIARMHLRRPGPRPRAAAQARARLPPGLQARAAVQRLVSGAVQAQRRARHRRDRRGRGAASSCSPTAAAARSTRSSSARAFTSPTRRRRGSCAGAAAMTLAEAAGAQPAGLPRHGDRPASPTCSASSARTPASGTTRWST